MGRQDRGPDDGDPRAPAPGSDEGLLERWMAHHEEQQDAARRPGRTDGGAGLGDWWATPADREPEPEPEPGSGPEPTAERDLPDWTPRPDAGAPVDVDFAPRRGTRRVLGVALLLMLIATGVAAWAARENPGPQSITLLACLAGLTLFTWAVRAGSSVTTLSVRGGQLHVTTGGRRTTFDLASGYTPVEVIGRPGHRGWKVVLGRGTMRPFTVDAGLVDPHEFMRVLRHYRPE